MYKKDYMEVSSDPTKGDHSPRLREDAFHTLPSALVLGLTPDGILRCISKGSERLLGCDPDQAIGKPFSNWLVAPDFDPNDHLGDLEKSLLRMRATGGEERDMLVTATLLNMERGESVVLLVLHDAAEALAGRALIEASETRLRAVLEGMLDAVLTIDDRGTIQDASVSVRRLFGYEPDELVGRNISLLMPPPHRALHDSYLTRYRETGRTWILDTTREFEVIGKDGRVLQVELSVSRVELPDRQEPLFVGSFRDITSRKRAEQALLASERRFRAIFDQEFQLVALLKQNGDIVEVNRTLLQMTGMSRSALLGRSFLEAPFWDSGSQGTIELARALSHSAKGQVARIQVSLIDREGVRRSLDLSIKSFQGPGASAADAGDMPLFLAEGRDVTELNAARRRETEVRDALAALGERAAVLAHEIRTPVTAVHMALRAVARELEQDEREVLEDLVARMRKLEDLLKGTLDFSSPIPLEPRRVSAAKLVDTTLALISEWVQDQPGRVRNEVPGDLPALLVDPARVAQALGNLVRNALEAIPKGGQIRICAARRGAERVAIWVDDDGPGIPPADRERLFQPFVTGRLDGNGIGLPLARRIAEAHQGSLDSLDSDLGGARFQLLLPCEPEEERPQ